MNNHNPVWFIDSKINHLGGDFIWSMAQNRAVLARNYFFSDDACLNIFHGRQPVHAIQQAFLQNGPQAPGTESRNIGPGAPLNNLFESAEGCAANKQDMGGIRYRKGYIEKTGKGVGHRSFAAAGRTDQKNIAFLNHPPVL